MEDITFRDMAHIWRKQRMTRYLFRKHRETDPRYLDGKWVGSINK